MRPGAGSLLLSVIRVVCVSGKPIMIITEFMENGALDAFLRVRRAED